jgi:hypothetical protein
MELSVRSPGFLSIFPLSRHLTERTVCTRSDAPPFQAFYVIRRDCCSVCVCVHSHILYRYILDVFFVWTRQKNPIVHISSVSIEGFLFPLFILFCFFRSSSFLDRTPPMCRGNRWWMMVLSILVLATYRGPAAVPADRFRRETWWWKITDSPSARLSDRHLNSIGFRFFIRLNNWDRSIER